ncbi:hypothetical protein CPAR01_02569 [Colletotrichum paranaense]|uniref:Uncharacterized protein n=1 Tax=Colletotrichum paranaense TaxID=1914294 RepID=A0ABQ9SZX4_9PEZI|nr:uncharacterized protein CPAR01_02569 [Colletotrichum paranaense]KAK1545067.1 hypothetical protein CPAR01_02569 [Colletotrichum paranaense]
MQMTLEAIIGIVALFVGLPPTCFILWKTCIRKGQKQRHDETAIIPLHRRHTIAQNHSPHYEQPQWPAPGSIWRSRTIVAFETEMNRYHSDEPTFRQSWPADAFITCHLGGHHA